MTNRNEADRPAEADPTDNHSGATRASYRKNWPVFATYCESIGATPLPASPAVVVQFIAAAGCGHLRRPGKSSRQTGEPTPFGTAMLEVVLSAIRDRHLQADLLSPTDDPAVCAARHGYRRDRDAEDTEAAKAPPLELDDLRALLSVTPEVSVEAVSVAACVLTALTLPGVRCGDLAHLRLRDLRCESSVQLRFRGGWVVVPCSCRPSWCRWAVPPCAACCLRTLESMLTCGEDDLLFRHWCRRGTPRAEEQTDRLAEKVKVLARKLPGRWPAITYRSGFVGWEPDATAEAREATLCRLGLALTGQLSALYYKALLLTAFRPGLRFDDAMRLPLRTTGRQAGSYQMHLPSAKNDQQGHGVWLRVPPSRERLLCAVCLLDEWAAVLRAAAGGRPVPLFAPVDDIGVRLTEPLT